jgi:hypothetical protein
MFMTLKPPKKGSAKSGMEQISFTEAGQGGAERRFGANRRNSCAYCQSKKVCLWVTWPESWLLKVDI